MSTIISIGPWTRSSAAVQGTRPTQIDKVIVRKGETAWMKHVVVEKVPAGIGKGLCHARPRGRVYPCD